MSQRNPLILLIVIAVAFVLSTILRSTSAAISSNNPAFAPVAVDDNYTVHHQLLLTPMTNDYNSDPYGGLSFNAVESQPQHGTLTQYNPESYTYHATYGYTGSDSFTYSVKDGLNNISTATVNITIVNQAPIAVPDFYIKVNSLLITPAANDFDPDVGDGLSFQSIVTQPHHGTLGV
jgi:Bacterial Ig domain